MPGNEVCTRGLSPRVRGNLMLRCNKPGTDGSIPACAGEPAPCSLPGPLHRVYPRVCGGTRETDGAALARWGLSPRVRGNHPTTMTRPKGQRSIPACAGEPRGGHFEVSVCKVYPRVCGGTNVFGEYATKKAGLSPRVRGNQLGVHTTAE